MNLPDARGLHDALPDVAHEARGMVAGQADVFVQMEQLDQVPADAGRGDQVLQEFHLRQAGGGHDSRGTVAGAVSPEGGADQRCGVLRGGLRSLTWMVEKAQSKQNVMIARVGRISGTAWRIGIGLWVATAAFGQT